MPKKPITPWTFVLDAPLRILIVDDDPILREFASVHLNSPFTTIDTACNGAEAKLMLTKAPYDVALLDIEMPKLDGFSLLEEIRADETLKQLRVIMLTGHDDIASIDRAYQLGADSFVTKPVNWRQLSYQIRYVVRTGQAESPATLDRSPGSKSTSTVSGVDNVLQSIVDCADELQRQLPNEDQVRLAKQIADLRTSVRVLSESLAVQTHESADRRTVLPLDRNFVDKRTRNAVGL